MEYFFLKLWDRSRRYIKNRDVAKVKEKRIQAQREPFSACFHDLEEEVLNISKSAERT
jgi:hypothetical protein